MTLFDQLFARRGFKLPAFDMPPLEFEETAAQADELLLDQVVQPPARQPFQAWARQVPTAGELRESIELHLHSQRAHSGRNDAADELREALAELRRSLG